MRRKEDRKAFCDLARDAIGDVGFEVKGEVLGELWNARAVVAVDLGICLMAVEMANGLRRTNAICAAYVVYVDFE